MNWQMEFLRTGTKSRDKTIRKYKPEIKNFFDNQTLRIIARYNDFFNIKANEPIINPADIEVLINYIFPLPQENTALKQSIKPLHTSGVQKAIEDIDDLTEATISASLTNIAVANAIATMGNRIVRINDTTRQLLREIITTGINDGTNIYDIANNIQATGLDEWYMNRSLAIARTETRMAYDSGGQIAYKDLGVEKFSVIGCVGTLAGTNELGLSASYGDFSEDRGSCGVTEIDMSMWQAVSDIHHINHNGLQTADKIP